MNCEWFDNKLYLVTTSNLTKKNEIELGLGKKRALKQKTQGLLRFYQANE